MRLPILPVRVVEANLLHNNEDQEVQYSGGEKGQLVATGAPPPDTELVQEEGEQCTNNEGIEGYPAEGLLVLSPVDLQQRAS